MDYKVLYRKYRPTNFNEVVGQDNTIKLLKSSIIDGKIAHAYIFSGPRGTGKTSTAKIFAKTINCLHSENGLPCGECENCRNFNSSSDIYEIDAASNNGVDQIREIIDNVKLSPISSKYKVYIIDEVHMLSTSAFNALLLTLEEPPAHALFILATTNIENVPITILSRCQRLDFKKISNEDIVKRLQEISKLENIDVTDDALLEIAYCADGGLRDALSILDQLSKKEEKITDDMVLDSIGVISNKKIEELFKSLESNDVNFIDSFILEAKTLAIDYKTLVRKLIDYILKKCILIKSGDEISNLGYRNLKNMSFELASTLYKANVNIDSYSMLELILLDYVKGAEKSIETPVITQKEVQKVEIDVKEVKTESKEPEKVAKKVEKTQNNEKNYFPGNNLELVKIRVNNCFAGAKKAKLNENKSKWMDYVAKSSIKSLKGVLIDTELVLSSDDIMVIKTDLEENASFINEHLVEIETEFKKLFDLKYKIITIDTDTWNEKTNEYKKNILNNIKYVMMEEPAFDEKKDNKILDDVFSIDKVEIE